LLLGGGGAPRAALDAREFERARAALEPLLGNPTQRVMLLMAEIEQVEHGDDGRAREWMARAVHAARDPAWTADGVVSDRWLPVSPASGRLDAFEWKVPLAELGRPDVDASLPPLPPRRVIDAAPPPRPAAEEPVTAEPVIESMPEPPPAEMSPPETAAPPAEPVRAASPARRARKPKAETVIPLLHVPDDPGPEAEPEQEPIPEPNAKMGRIF
jgi:HemY protein